MTTLSERNQAILDARHKRHEAGLALMVQGHEDEPKGEYQPQPQNCEPVVPNSELHKPYRYVVPARYDAAIKEGGITADEVMRWFGVSIRPIPY